MPETEPNNERQHMTDHTIFVSRSGDLAFRRMSESDKSALTDAINPFVKASESLPAAASSPTPCTRELTAEDWLIFDLVCQAITPNANGEYFSEFIGCFAAALRHCCKSGLMVVSGGYSIDEEDRVFAAKKRSKYGVRHAHDPATCWHCLNEKKAANA